MNNISQTILSTVALLGAELNNPALANPSPETRLFGADGLDSIALVTLIADLEEKLSEAAGRPVVLADERAMSRFHSPFRTVGTLIGHAEKIVGDDGK